MRKGIWPKLFSGPPERRFSAWQIELTTRCPLRCTMCCREGQPGLARKDMSSQDFQKILPYLREVEAVVLEGWGESTLHPHLIEIVRLVKKTGAQVGFVTSGQTLHDEYVSDLVRADTDFIGFSLSGTTAETHDSIRVNSHLPELLTHIRRFQEIKGRLKSPHPRLHVVYLLLKTNMGEVPALVNLAKDLGIQEVILIHMALISNPWQEELRIFAREDMEEWERILNEAEKMARSLKIHLRRPPLAPREVAVCSENPLRNLYISVSGNVSPCVYLRPPLPSPFRRIFHGAEFLTGKVGFGNIFQKPFGEIWEDEKYKEFRACFSRRQGKMDEMTAALWDPDKRSGVRSYSLPDPPSPCQTCYKIEGF